MPEGFNFVVFIMSFPPDEIKIYEHWMYFETFWAVQTHSVSTIIRLVFALLRCYTV